MGRPIQKLRLVGLSVSALLFVAAFQNCGGGARMRLSGTSAPAQASSGNGGSYDGKPAPGNYVRQYPDGCATSTEKDVIGKLLVDVERATVTDDVCVPQKYNVEFTDSRMEYS